MLYPEVDRVSPARIAKSLPVMPSVEPPLSVYLLVSVLQRAIIRRLLILRIETVLLICSC